MNLMDLHPVLYIQLQLGPVKHLRAKREISNSSKQALHHRRRLQISSAFE